MWLLPIFFYLCGTLSQSRYNPLYEHIFLALVQCPLLARRDVPPYTSSLAAEKPWEEDSLWWAVMAQGFSPVI